MNMIYKSFYRKKNVKTYLLIIISLMVILNLALIFKSYMIDIVNSNYNKSFIYVVVNDDIELKKIKEYDNVKEIKKCVFDDLFIVEDNSIENNQIYISDDNNNEYTNDYVVNKSQNLQQNVMMISSDLFSQLHYVNGYYITLDNWFDNSEFLDYLLSLNVKPDAYIYKNNDIDYESSFVYLNVVIVLLSWIFVIVYFFTIISIIVDQKKINKMLKILGFNKKYIFKYDCVKLISLNLICILLNEILNIIVYIFSGLYNISVYLYITLLNITLMLLIFNYFLMNKEN